MPALHPLKRLGLPIYKYFHRPLLDGGGGGGDPTRCKQAGRPLPSAPSPFSSCDSARHALPASQSASKEPFPSARVAVPLPRVASAACGMGRGRIRALAVSDVRFPTSLAQHGSDAMVSSAGLGRAAAWTSGRASTIPASAAQGCRTFDPLLRQLARERSSALFSSRQAFGGSLSKLNGTPAAFPSPPLPPPPQIAASLPGS